MSDSKTKNRSLFDRSQQKGLSSVMKIDRLRELARNFVSLSSTQGALQDDQLVNEEAMEGSIDWQNVCRDLKSRGLYLLETEKWADCRFLVGTESNQQVLSGHKLILAMASPVFERMFYGNVPEKTDPIQIPDVQPDAFRAMMEYIYSDKINISSFDKACELCYVAKKYLLPHVVEQCTKYLWSDLSPKNACRAYEFAKLFEEPQLMQRCIQIICTKTREVLADPTFMEIELTTLLIIFDQDQLNIDSELELFNALNKYAYERGYISKKCDSIPESHEASMEPQLDVESMQEASTSRETKELSPGEGTSNCDESQDSEEKYLDELLIKEAVKKIRFLTLTPQQFAEGPARSRLLTQAEALNILINISSPSINDCPMPEGFCSSRNKRNCFARCDEQGPSGSFSKHNDNVPLEYAFSPPTVRQECIRTPPVVLSVSYSYQHPIQIPEPDISNAMETRKFYCVRTIRQQIDYRNTSVTDCALTFHTNANILITGVQVPTQVLCGELMNSAGFTERYSEILYAHLLDAQGSRLTYTHCTSRVRYDSLLEISFDRPVFIIRNKIYKIGVVFNKVGWYPMYTCYAQVTCDNVHFTFNVGAPHESLRDGLIRAIVFTHPYAAPGPHSNAMVEM